MDDRLRNLLGNYAGQEVILGVRPEAMSLHAEGRFAGQENVLPLEIKVVEPLGEKMDVYAGTPKHPHVVARIDAERGLEPSQRINVYLAMDKVHIFASDDEGENLSLN